MGEIEASFLKTLLGLTEKEAISICQANNYSWRIVRKDGINLIITMDLKLNRLNFYVDNGKITKVDFG